jgi:predicted permease
VVLLVGAALLVRSFTAVLRVNPGFSADGVLTLRLSLPRSAYPTTGSIAQFYEQLAERLRSIPGVDHVAAANVVPMNGWLATSGIRVPGFETATEWPEAHYRMVSAAYLDALRIPLLAGRGFTTHDRQDSAPVALISRGLADAYWRGGTPVGERIMVRDNGGQPREVEIVGVVGDVRHQGLEVASPHELYVPVSQVPDPMSIWLANNMYWVIKTSGDPLALSAAVRAEVRAADPAVATSFMRTMAEWLDGPLQTRRLTLQLMLLLAITAVTLALTGIYAVISETVATRTRELALRSALGASVPDLRWVVLRDGIWSVASGVALGLALSVGLAQLISAFLFGVDARDTGTFVVVSVLTAAAGALAVYAPARSASRIDPVLALRE